MRRWQEWLLYLLALVAIVAVALGFFALQQSLNRCDEGTQECTSTTDGQ